eukprot:TRINITY_DN2062_c0_g1_i1.p1 TRINITY_DN2062_c0_g1~~TRINITY_DN2062_c0_g1_i1.p1  ORF type:complete len:103 (+),score=25.59 TRINITY_DN2062_c0_g1_i1:3-311(+)
MIQSPTPQQSTEPSQHTVAVIEHDDEEVEIDILNTDSDQESPIKHSPTDISPAKPIEPIITTTFNTTAKTTTTPPNPSSPIQTPEPTEESTILLSPPSSFPF